MSFESAQADHDTRTGSGTASVSMERNLVQEFFEVASIARLHEALWYVCPDVWENLKHHLVGIQREALVQIVKQGLMNVQEQRSYDVGLDMLDSIGLLDEYRTEE